MLTAVDSSILLDVIVDAPGRAEPAEESLRQATSEGGLVPSFALRGMVLNRPAGGAPPPARGTALQATSPPAALALRAGPGVAGCDVAPQWRN